MSLNKPFSYTFLILFSIHLILLLGSSCSKETLKSNQVAIESFTVLDNKGNKLHASIVNNEIFIYWPPFEKIPESIKPEIIVSNAASIQPASNVEVKTTHPVQYRVQAENKESKTYTLKIIENQPLLKIYVNLADNKYIIGNAMFNIFTEHIILDDGKTQVFLIDEQNREIPMGFSIRNANIIYLTAFESDPKIGTYRIKVISGIRTVISDPFKIIIPPLIEIIHPNSSAVLVKKSSQITFSIDIEKYNKFYKNSTFKVSLFDKNQKSYPINDFKFDVALKTFSFTIPADFTSGRMQDLVFENVQTKEIDKIQLSHITVE